MAAQIVTIPEVKTFLNISSSTFDAELSDFIDAASAMIVNRIGPVTGNPTYDEWYDGGSSQIVLRHAPVQSITSVTESFGAQSVYTLTPQVLDSGIGMGTYGYSLDQSSLLTRRTLGVATPFAAGVNNIHIVYVAGYAVTPADIRLACKLLLLHMWATQRGGSQRPGVGGQDTVGASFSWPDRVEEILADYYIPGIA